MALFIYDIFLILFKYIDYKLTFFIKLFLRNLINIFQYYIFIFIKIK